MVPKLRQMGHEVYVITLNARALDAFTVDLKQYQKPRSYFRRAADKFLFKLFPDLAGFYAVATPLSRAIVYLVKERGVQILEMEEAFGWNSVVANLQLIPVVVRLHGPWFINKRHDDKARERRERVGIENATLVTSPSAIILDRVKNSHRVTASVTIPNPINHERDSWDINKVTTQSILCVGRFDNVKGGDFVLQVFHELASRFPSLTLTFVGPDNGVEDENGKTVKFEEYARALCSDSERMRIQFRGILTPDEIKPLRLTHYLTVCASNSEVLPYSILEAMSLGCPIVTTDAGGIPEMIRDCQNGRIVRKGDLSAFVRACEELLLDPRRAASYGRQAKLDCELHYNLDVLAQTTASVFAKTIEARSLSKVL